MNLIIQHKKDNPLLHRVEVDGILEFSGATPSNAQVCAAIAKELKTQGDLVKMDHIYTLFSKQSATFQAYVYANKEALSTCSLTTKHIRKRMEEEAKKKAQGDK